MVCRAWWWLLLGAFGPQLLVGQTFVSAQWLNKSGTHVTGEVILPTHAYSREERIRYRLSEDEPALLQAQDLRWLVVGNDTLFYRRQDELLQLLTSGQVAIYRELSAKRTNHYYFREGGRWLVANNRSLRQDVDSLWTTGDCVQERNGGRRYQWQDAALVGEDLQDCLGESPNAVYRILGPLEYRQWSLGTNLGGPLGAALGTAARTYSLQLGLSQQYRRVNRGFYLDAQLMFFHFRDRRPVSVFDFSGLTFSTSTYNQDWRLTGLLASAGVRLDVAPNRRTGPFFGIGYGLLLPLADRQEIRLAEGAAGIAGWPSRLTARNTVIVGHGSYTDVGWRFSLNGEWAFRVHLRIDPRTINTNYRGSSLEAVQLLNSQEEFSSLSFGSRLEFWVQKQFGQRN